MSYYYDDPLDQRPGETAAQWRQRLVEASKAKSDRAWGNPMATRNEDGSLRGGGNAEFFEKFGWF